MVGPLNTLGAKVSANSRRWFPQVYGDDHGAVVHATLGLTGEAGEVANLVKKLSYRPGQVGHGGGFEEARDRIGEEIADAVTCALVLANVLGVDLDDALARKVAICEQRWGT